MCDQSGGSFEDEEVMVCDILRIAEFSVFTIASARIHWEVL